MATVSVPTSGRKSVRASSTALTSTPNAARLLASRAGSAELSNSGRYIRSNRAGSSWANRRYACPAATSRCSGDPPAAAISSRAVRSVKPSAASALSRPARCAKWCLVARSADRLRTVAAEIERTQSVRVEVVPTDLADRDAVEHLAGRIGDRVHLLVNNAGYGSYGPFATLDPDREYNQVLVNNAALV